MDPDEPIPLSRPSLGEAELAAVEYSLLSGELVLGRENARFEQLLAETTGRAYALCVSSGAVALELALWALEPTSGQHALMPAGGYPAAAHAAVRAGLAPALVDLDPDTWTMDVAAAAAGIGPETRAVVSIDTHGLVAEAAPLEALIAEAASASAHRAGPALVVDAACSLGGADSTGRPGAGYGTVAVLSFHPRKIITTGEGGALVCDHEDLAARLRALRDQGQSAPGQFAHPGTNARLAEPSAALGRVQLGRLDAILRERALLVAGYRERLQHLREAGVLTRQQAPDGARSAHQGFAVMLSERPHLPSAAQVRAYLAQAGIASTVAGYALHRLDSVRPHLVGPSQFPVADALAERGISLPLYIGMRSAQLDRICDTLAEVVT